MTMHATTRRFPALLLAALAALGLSGCMGLIGGGTLVDDGGSSAPVTISAGQTVTGAISNGDMTLEDDSKADDYIYHGRSGERLTVTMRSGDFDTYLFLGTITGGRWNLITRDDDGADGTNSRIVHTLPYDGAYRIRANAYRPSERGGYTLSVTSSGASAPAPSVAARSTRIGPGTVNAELGSSSRSLTDGSYFDEYVFNGRQGDRVAIDMRSTEFDAYLYLGTLDGSTWNMLTTDDDGGNGTDARIEYTLETDRDYVIRANAYRPGDAGRYTLSLERAGATADPIIIPRAAGSTVRLDNVFFDVGQATLRSESYPELDRLLAFMRENPTAEIEIAGHTDSSGSADVNRRLSQDRAGAVAEYLVSNGIERSRVTARGYGSAEPAATNETEEGRQRNRRVEVRVLRI